MIFVCYDRCTSYKKARRWLEDELADMTDDQKLHLISTDGMLVRCPLLVGSDFVMVGFRRSDWEDIL